MRACLIAALTLLMSWSAHAIQVTVDQSRRLLEFNYEQSPEMMRFDFFNNCEPMLLDVFVLLGEEQDKYEAPIRATLQDKLKEQLSREYLFRTKTKENSRSSSRMTVMISSADEFSFFGMIQFQKTLHDPKSGLDRLMTTWERDVRAIHNGQPFVLAAYISQYVEDFLVYFMKINEPACHG